MKFNNKNFNDEEVRLDSNEFTNCTFTDCKMVYGGTGKVGMRGCKFSNVNWTLADAAANTIQFMTAMYHGAGAGGKQLIESTFDNIRKGSTPILP